MITMFKMVHGYNLLLTQNGNDWMIEEKEA